MADNENKDLEAVIKNQKVKPVAMASRKIETSDNTSKDEINSTVKLRETHLYFEPPVLFVHPKDEEITPEVIKNFIDLHQGELPRYKYLYDMYKGKHEILNQKEKEAYKPDNRLVVNISKYLVDTFNGYFDGIPIKVMHPTAAINETVKQFNKRVEMDDNFYEIAKMCSIFGRCYAIAYQNEKTETCVTYSSPLDMFIVYDDTIAKNPLFGVRYNLVEGGYKGELHTLDTKYLIEPADNDFGFILTDDPAHAFYEEDLSIVEFIENEERTSLFEPIITLNNALNKAMSEKGNDVDYFADAYLAILGAKVDDKSAQKMRDNRMINLYSDNEQLDASKIVAKFLEKPNADDTQEHYLDRLERFIFTIAMVVNISDEDFGNSSSGESLMYKLLNMSNLALTKERKFVSSMNKIYKMFFSVPLNFEEGNPDEIKEEWFNLEYQFTRNTPKNLVSEAEIVSKLKGIISDETLLKVLSIVANPREEIEKMKAEAKGGADDSNYIEGGALNDTFSDILGEETSSTVEETGEGPAEI